MAIFKKTKNGNLRTIEIFGFKHTYDRNSIRRSKVAFSAKIKNAKLGGANIIRKNVKIFSVPKHKKYNGINIFIGKGTDIGESTVISTGEDYKVTIGENCRIGKRNEIGGGPVEIGNYVLMASDIKTFPQNHAFEDVATPIMYQGVGKTGKIIIKEESWIGANVTILSGVTIGKHCVIGSGAIVTKSIPDYSVAVGNPAKIIKQYDFEKEQWVKI